jgi:hypothetical protein
MKLRLQKLVVRKATFLTIMSVSGESDNWSAMTTKKPISVYILSE